MADVKKIATRQSYGEELVALGAEHDDFVVFDADLAAATQSGKFKAAYPDRFFDAGIAEGIEANSRKVEEAVRAAAWQAYEATKTALDIHSLSFYCLHLRLHLERHHYAVATAEAAIHLYKRASPEHTLPALAVHSHLGFATPFGNTEDKGEGDGARGMERELYPPVEGIGGLFADMTGGTVDLHTDLGG